MSSSDELIRLSPDEAFVLYDFAHRLVLDIAGEESEAIFEDRGEWSALSSVLGQLETRLPQIFMPDYRERLHAARLRLRPLDDESSEECNKTDAR
ncbi:hypothetical protein [Actinomadura roseirufa]|uniref:hypothetical protein n=1 Tax=Actinomadura roseirufa TaxID=2094049 RepID=UPI001041902A|nr:hypothetical protein [Actinomadura roseirufa]